MIYLTGVGALHNSTATGQISPSSPLSRADLSYSATVGGQPAQIDFLGLTPGFLGLAQCNLVIPNLADDDYPLTITIGNNASDSPYLAKAANKIRLRSSTQDQLPRQKIVSVNSGEFSRSSRTTRRMMIGTRPGGNNPLVIVIRRKIKPRTPARAETWKLAYADFVTALMALFSVLWLLGSSPNTQRAVGAYFHEPAPTANNINHLAKQLQTALQQNPGLGSLSMQVRMSSSIEGLRVDLLERNRTPLFETGRENPTQAGTNLLKGIARELGNVPNRIALEGHTDSRPYSGRKGYTNWELSIDRANAARRVMVQNGLRPGQVSQVFGSADQNPGVTENPDDAENRRVTVIVLNAPPL